MLEFQVKIFKVIWDSRLSSSEHGWDWPLEIPGHLNPIKDWGELKLDFYFGDDWFISCWTLLLGFTTSACQPKPKEWIRFCSVLTIYLMPCGLFKIIFSLLTCQLPAMLGKYLLGKKKSTKSWVHMGILTLIGLCLTDLYCPGDAHCFHTQTHTHIYIQYICVRYIRCKDSRFMFKEWWF